jgi:co-chaperonin GroES (HSP10)
MKALNSFIVVQPLKIEQEESKTGLIVTAQEATKQRYQKAVVLVECENHPNIKIGDTIAYDAVQGHDIKLDINGQKTQCRVIQYRDVALIF